MQVNEVEYISHDHNDLWVQLHQFLCLMGNKCAWVDILRLKDVLSPTRYMQYAEIDRRFSRCCAHIIFLRDWQAQLKVNIQFNFEVSKAKVKIQFRDV